MKRRLIPALPAIVAAILLLTALFFFKVIRVNGLFIARDAAWGVDVSQYQGEIDWDALVAQGVRFAYIKATEGSGTVDTCFANNWENAAQAGVPAGAYHFFSFDSPAETQAQNYISVVPAAGAALPPAIDVELYGAYKRSPKPRLEVIDEIRALSDALETRYGVKPVLYVTHRSYELYISGAGFENPLWVRDVYLSPYWAKDWFMWQYSDRGRLKGYDGEEAFVDLNAMNAKSKAFR